jgi:hypothetical protein
MIPGPTTRQCDRSAQFTSTSRRASVLKMFNQQHVQNPQNQCNASVAYIADYRSLDLVTGSSISNISSSYCC